MSAENPRGKGSAESSTDATDKEFSCPTCDRADFKSLNGLSIHHSKAHGEKLDTRTSVECSYCGDCFKIHQYRLNEADRHFCPDSGCYGKWQSENNTSEDARAWSGDGREIECDRCGEMFYVEPHRVDDAKYCSRDCAHPTKRKEIECEICGVNFEVANCRHDDARFCSFECKGEWMKTAYAGENNPTWNEGYVPEYGPNWRDQSEKARKRDGFECQICGLPQSDHHRALAVHHIIPRSEFIKDDGCLDWRRANDLDNFITLCDSCHQRAERIAPLIPQPH